MTCTRRKILVCAKAYTNSSQLVQKKAKKYVFWRIRIGYVILKIRKKKKKISYGERSERPPEPKLEKIVRRNRVAMLWRLNP